MKKINNLIVFIISFFASTNLHAQDFVLSEIISPDSLFFCKSQTFVVKALVEGYISDTFRISYQLGNRPRVEEVIPKPNNVPNNSVLYTFRTPLAVPDSINDTLRVTILTADSSPNNNTLFTILRSTSVYTLPFSEDFEQSRFPPLDWSATPVWGYNAGWVKNQFPIVNQNGQPTTALYFWEGSEQRSGISPPERTSGMLTLPPIDLKNKKNPYCVFNLGLPYEPFLSFGVDISTDCGVNFKTIYTKEGRYGKYYYAPRMHEWMRDSVSLLPYLDKTVLLRFYAKHGNKDGQVIGTYLDSIRVYDAPILAKDVAVNQIVSPVLGSFCTSKFQLPVVVNIKNTGMAALDTFVVSYQLEGGTPSVSDTVVRNLTFGQTFNHTFSKPSEIPLNGGINLSLFVKVNGDEDPRNNVLSLNDATFPRYRLPYVEDFEQPFGRPLNFPDLQPNANYDWFLYDPNKTIIGSNGKPTSAAYSLFNNWDKQRIYMIPPFLDLRNNTTPFLTFDVAYARLDSTILATTGRKQDTLRVQISTDCGQSFKTIYEKRGNTLATSSRIGRPFDMEWTPNSATDWRRDTVDLTPFKDSIVLVRFASLMGGYSSTFIDNLKTEAGYDYDLGIVEKVQPTSILICARDRSALPVRLILRNNAFLTANTVQLSYQLDTEGVVSETLNRRINPRDTVQFQFRQLLNIATIGKHNLTIFITYTNDQNTKNDTLKTILTVGNDYKPNLLEDFELTTFPPVDWQWKLTKAKGWDRILTVGSVNNQLTIVAIANANYEQSEVGGTESLISYPVDLRNRDKIKLLFDRFSPNFDGDPYRDSLRIDVSTDCGITYQSTGYLKTGAALSTGSNRRGFIPEASTDWKTDTLDLSAFKNHIIQVRFSRIFQTTRFNIMLDNIRFADSASIVNTQETPYSASFSKIFPNPTTDNIDIVFDKIPTQSIKLVLLNAQGQLVKQEIKSLWDTPQYKWSLQNLPTGIYMLIISNYPQFEQHKIIIAK